MIAMLLAAQLTAEIERGMPAAAVRAMPAEVAQPAAQETPNLYRPRPGCRELQFRTAQHQAETFRKLGRLPNAARQYAVLRQVDGCPVPAPMGYHPPALPGAADAPAMRGDAPSNRR